ncbi:MAG: phospholipase/carboxylesterase [Massilia sp.]|jgi:predicted esterase
MNELGHLSVQLPAPGATPISPAAAGLQKLEVGSPRDSYIYVPEGYRPDQPMPLVLLLHGAGGHAHDGMRIMLHLADKAGLILAAPASHASTWDIIARRSYGKDLALVDRTLEHVFQHYAIDTTRLGIGGFSDGASYALTVGLANGDLFTHVLAFSPGFIGPMEQQGAPEVFVSHGDADTVLPIDPCGRTIARQLRAAAYPLTFREFQGGHAIPPDIATDAVNWFLFTGKGHRTDHS